MAKDFLKEKIIVAFDFADMKSVHHMAKLLQSEVKWVKIGMELYLSQGPQIIEELKKYNYKIFLDLKLHDIPTTVAKALYSLASLGVDMTNIHAAGGLSMMKMAHEYLLNGAKSNGLEIPKLIAVTHLTSTDQNMLNSELKIPLTLHECISSYAELTKSAGLDGVVCSAQETALIKQKCGKDFLTITPGIRPLDSSVQDQKRVVTPKQALENGTDYMVIGRPITEATDPLEAFKKIINSL